MWLVVRCESGGLFSALAAKVPASQPSKFDIWQLYDDVAGSQSGPEVIRVDCYWTYRAQRTDASHCGEIGALPIGNVA